MLCVCFHSTGGFLTILRLARNAVDPARRAREVQPNACPVKVLCFWSSGNVNLPVQRSILPLKESANAALKCVKSAFTTKYAKVLQRTGPDLAKIHLDLTRDRLTETYLKKSCNEQKLKKTDVYTIAYL